MESESDQQIQETGESQQEDYLQCENFSNTEITTLPSTLFQSTSLFIIGFLS